MHRADKAADGGDGRSGDRDSGSGLITVELLRLLTVAAVSVEQDGVSGFVAVELPSLPTVAVIECSTRSIDRDGGSGLV